MELSTNNINQADEKQPAASSSQIMKSWNRLGRIQRELLLFVFMPVFLCTLYVLFWHSPMYISSTQFAVRSSNEMGMGTEMLSQLFNTGNGSVQNARIVEQYLKTRDIFREVDKELGLVNHYSDSKHDFISRLSRKASLREQDDFWKKVSSVSLDADTGTITFMVRAYSPEMAQSISKSILTKSEQLVNSMNLRSHEDTLKIAKQEVKLAESKVAKAQDALKKFRDNHKDVDLKSTLTGLQTLIIDLETNRSNLQAKLSEAKSYMKPESAAVQTLEKKLIAVTRQLDSEKRRLTDLNSSDSINQSVSEYEHLLLNQEFAQKQLLSALTSLEAARIQLLSKTSYLVPISEPSLPDESEYPKVFLFSFCLALGFLMIYGLFSLVFASVKEHVGFR